MNLTEFKEKVDSLDKKDYNTNELDVMITKATGDTLFCLLHDNEEVVDYFKVD